MSTNPRGLWVYSGDFGLPRLRHAAGHVDIKRYLCIVINKKDMQLNKKLGDNLATACYTSDGLALRLSGKDDKFANSIALVEVVDGEIHLVLFDDAIKRYGIKIEHENIAPEKW